MALFLYTYLGSNSKDTRLRVTEENSHFFCPPVYVVHLVKLANFFKWTKKVADFANKKSLYVSKYTVGLASLGQQ